MAGADQVPIQKCTTQSKLDCLKIKRKINNEGQRERVLRLYSYNDTR